MVGDGMKFDKLKETYKEQLNEAAWSYEAPSHRECYGCCQSDSDYEKAFRAGAEWEHKRSEGLIEKIEEILNYVGIKASVKTTMIQHELKEYKGEL